MEKQSRRGKRRCGNFAWRDDDPAWRAERKNDKIVFKKIRRETARGRSADKVIAALFTHPFWASRMSGKTPKSWKEQYSRWKNKHRVRGIFVDDVQAEKSSFDPCKHWAEFIDKRFCGKRFHDMSRKPRQSRRGEAKDKS